MPGIPTSQGATVSFAGSPLGQLLMIKAVGGSASGKDVTALDCAIVGAGDESRAVKVVDVLEVDSGRCDVTFLGTPATTEAGAKGQLEVVIGGVTVLSGEAFLASYDVEATVGDLVKGSASFQLTGN